MKVWILTCEYNEYDQYGEYFIGAFASRPSKEVLMENGLGEYEAENLLTNGSGRQTVEYCWYNLRHVMLYDNQESKIMEWETWFAWYPVRTVDCDIVWFEYVERRLNETKHSRAVWMDDPGDYVFGWDYRKK